MSTKPKFDPSRVASLLSRGAEEGGRGPLASAPAPVLASVPAPVEAEVSAPSTAAATDSVVAAATPARAASQPRMRQAGVEPETAEISSKRPITVRLSEEVIHALVRHQAEVRCKPGVRLGETTIGGVMDSLLRGPLGLA